MFLCWQSSLNSNTADKHLVLLEILNSNLRLKKNTFKTYFCTPRSSAIVHSSVTSLPIISYIGNSNSPIHLFAHFTVFMFFSIVRLKNNNKNNTNVYILPSLIFLYQPINYKNLSQYTNTIIFIFHIDIYI